MQLQHLTIDEVAGYLEGAAHIAHSADVGARIVHIGIDAAGNSFVLVHDAAEGGRLGFLDMII